MAPKLEILSVLAFMDLFMGDCYTWDQWIYQGCQKAPATGKIACYFHLLVGKSNGGPQTPRFVGEGGGLGLQYPVPPSYHIFLLLDSP